ncbi:MAG: hypothetical protein ACOX9R_19710 [Armatimonadota bacterium]|jgi:hypothetical protein
MRRFGSQAFQEPIGVRLSDSELALLLGLPVIRPEVAALLTQARHDAGSGVVELTFYDLGELAGCVALEASHTEDEELETRLQRLFRHLVDAMRAASRRELRRSATAHQLPLHMPLDDRVPSLEPLQLSLGPG